MSLGLRTALELLKKNVSVTLKSARPPLDPSTTSMGAGGLWMPYHCDDPRTEQWAMETLDDLLLTSNNYNKHVEVLPTVVFKKDHTGPEVMDYIAQNYDMKGTGGSSPLPLWTTDSRLQFQHLTVEMLSWQNTIFKLRIPSQAQLVAAGYKHAWFFKTPIVDSPNMLTVMFQDIIKHPNTVAIHTDHEYHSMQQVVEDAKDLGCDAVVNCTSLGSQQLCDDNELIPARGLLLHFDRHTAPRSYTSCTDPDGANVDLIHDSVLIAEDEPWGTPTEPCYMIPRGNKLLVGGTYHEGDVRTEMSASERATLLENAQILGIAPNAPVVDEWVGFRPVRPAARCDLDDTYRRKQGVQVVHSYGYGGSGWTVFVGAAKEAVRLLGL